MRLIGKLLALPFMLVTGILYLVCKFLVVLSGAVLGILSGIIFLAALVLFFVAGFLPGLAWLMIAFLISPYGLPLAAAWLVGIIGGAKSALKGFLFGLAGFAGRIGSPALFSAIITILIGGILLRDTTPIYYHSASYAREHGELNWR